MRLHRQPPAETVAADALSPPERLAVWTLRCVDQDPRTCQAGARAAPAWLAGDLQSAIALLRAFQREMATRRWTRLRMAAWGSLHLTRDERRLLRAVAAFQAGQTELADNLLFRFAASHTIRCGLAHAVAELAAALGAGGYWLPQPAQAWPLPAGALAVARLHGAELGKLSIAWP